MAPPVVVPEISALQLALTLEEDGDLQVVDVRPRAAVAAGHIDVAPDRFHHIVGADLLRCRRLDETAIDPTLPAAVVCSRGHDSAIVAAHLNALGCAARSLGGGMAAWMTLVRARRLAPPPSLDLLVQFDRPGNAALGYLLVSGGEALIVDPPRDSAEYLRAADDAKAVVTGVADTHLHADYISGAVMLARALEVPYYLHARDAVSPYDGTPGRLDFQPVADGDAIGVGGCAVRVAHMPGHTEGSVSFLIDEAYALSGDFIFVSSVGRPDLANRTAEWTADLWRSLETAKRAWPEDLVVCPAHYGSARERRPDRTVAAPFGRLLRENEALRFSDWPAFAQWVERRSGSFPDSYRAIKMINLGLRSVDAESAEELENGRNQCALSAPS